MDPFCPQCQQREDCSHPELFTLDSLLPYPYTIHPSVRMATTHRKRASLDFFYCPTQVHCQVQPSLSPKASRHLPSHCYGDSLTLWGIACCLASRLLPALWVLLWLPIIHSPYPVCSHLPLESKQTHHPPLPVTGPSLPSFHTWT